MARKYSRRSRPCGPCPKPPLAPCYRTADCRPNWSRTVPTPLPAAAGR